MVDVHLAKNNMTLLIFLFYLVRCPTSYILTRAILHIASLVAHTTLNITYGNLRGHLNTDAKAHENDTLTARTQTLVTS